MSDPAFRKLVAVGEQEAPGTRAYCHACHSNVGTVTNRFVGDTPFDEFEAVIQEGVTCESCHRIKAVFRPSNAGHLLDPSTAMQGTRRAGDRSPYHDTEPSNVLDTAELCASCHDVESTAGVALEQPYVEWSRSPARAEGVGCADCHMPFDASGPAAQGFGLPERPLRRHTFLSVGAAVWAAELEPTEAEEVRAAVQRELQQSATISLRTPGRATRGSPLRVQVVFESRVPGHRFPTGSTFFRQVWAVLRVTDADGAPIFSVDGSNDRAGDAAGARSLFLSARLLDARDQPTLFPWRAVRLDNRALEPLETRPVDIAVEVPDSVRGPLRVEAALHFRTFSDELLGALDLPPELGLDFEIGRTSQRVDLVP